MVDDDILEVVSREVFQALDVGVSGRWTDDDLCLFHEISFGSSLDSAEMEALRFRLEKSFGCREGAVDSEAFLEILKSMDKSRCLVMLRKLGYGEDLELLPLAKTSSAAAQLASTGSLSLCNGVRRLVEFSSPALQFLRRSAKSLPSDSEARDDVDVMVDKKSVFYSLNNDEDDERLLLKSYSFSFCKKRVPEEFLRPLRHLAKRGEYSKKIKRRKWKASNSRGDNHQITFSNSSKTDAANDEEGSTSVLFDLLLQRQQQQKEEKPASLEISPELWMGLWQALLLVSPEEAIHGIRRLGFRPEIWKKSATTTASILTDQLWACSAKRHSYSCFVILEASSEALNCYAEGSFPPAPAWWKGCSQSSPFWMEILRQSFYEDDDDDKTDIVSPSFLMPHIFVLNKNSKKKKRKQRIKLLNVATSYHPSSTTNTKHDDATSCNRRKNNQDDEIELDDSLCWLNVFLLFYDESEGDSGINNSKTVQNWNTLCKHVGPPDLVVDGCRSLEEPPPASWLFRNRQQSNLSAPPPPLRKATRALSSLSRMLSPSLDHNNNGYVLCSFAELEAILLEGEVQLRKTLIAHNSRLSFYSTYNVLLPIVVVAIACCCSAIFFKRFRRL